MWHRLHWVRNRKEEEKKGKKTRVAVRKERKAGKAYVHRLLRLESEVGRNSMQLLSR